MIPMEHEKCGYERQEEGMIPTAFEKRGYERREEGMIPTLFMLHGYHVLFPPQVPTQAISMRIDIHCQGSVVHGAIPGHPGVL